VAKKILLVDDDRDLVANYKAVLEREGFAVSVAHSAAEGLKACLAGRPDLVILDVSMETDTAGFEFLYQLRSEREGSRYRPVRGTPVLLLTAIHQVTNSRFSLDESGSFLPKVEGMLSKPVKLEALVAAARRAAGGA